MVRLTVCWVVAGVLVSRVSSQCSPSPCGIHTTCEVNAGGAAVCRCEAGWDHAPGSNTIEGGWIIRIPLEAHHRSRDQSDQLLCRLSEQNLPLPAPRPPRGQQPPGWECRSYWDPQAAAETAPGPLRSLALWGPGRLQVHWKQSGLQLPARIWRRSLHRLLGRPLLSVTLWRQRHLRTKWWGEITRQTGQALTTLDLRRHLGEFHTDILTSDILVMYSIYWNIFFSLSSPFSDDLSVSPVCLRMNVACRRRSLTQCCHH